MDRVIGQDKALSILRSALTSGRTHHAYVFHGPAGVGKFTAAKALARVLLCHQPRTTGQGPAACGRCESCRLMDAKPPQTRLQDDQGNITLTALASAHPDFHVVTKELARFSDDALVRARKLLTIPLDVLKSALLVPVYRAASLRHGKVFIVDEAELIDGRGQNVLLKTLEEPPEGTYIILVTSSEDRLLVTIRSRCQRVAFVPLADESVRAWLKDESPELGRDEVAFLLRFAAGSLGRASLAMKYKLYAWSTLVLPALKQMESRRYPAELGATMAKLIDDLAAAWVDDHPGASKEAANKMAAGLMWTLISQEARAKLVELAAPAPGSGPATGNGAAGEPLEPWLGVIDALRVVETELAANVNMGLACDHLASLLYRALSRETASAV